jgi:hypothetical protein
LKTKILAVFLVIAGCFAAVHFIRVARAADKKYEPNEVQSLRLQVMHKDAELAQIAFQQAQQNFSAKLNLLNAEAEVIKKQNKWPTELLFNPDTMQFTPPPKPAPTPPAKK